MDPFTDIFYFPPTLPFSRALSPMDDFSSRVISELMWTNNCNAFLKEIASSVKELANYIQNRMTGDEKIVIEPSRSTGNLDKTIKNIIGKDKNAQLIILPEYNGSLVPETRTKQASKDKETCTPSDPLACSNHSKETSIAIDDDNNTEDSEKPNTSALHYNTPVSPKSAASADHHEAENKPTRYKPMTVSASSMNDVMRYTTEYKEFIRKIPVYRPSLQPWKVISRISSHFVDEALRDIIKELDFDHLVKMMYKLEFE